MYNPTNMAAPLLATKFYFPKVHTKLVHRPRLLEVLNQGVNGPLTLISAPAGSGKTTLLSAWRTERGNNRPTAWLSLDGDDNEPIRFLTYLATAIDSIKRGILKNSLTLITSAQPPARNVLLNSLINELADFGEDLILVLDDYHLITEPDIHKDFTYLLEHIPPLLHVVILTRADPPFPTARLRVRNQLTEIRADDLRFTPGESRVFLNDIMQLALSNIEVEILEGKTEGWVAGLQLAALSLRDRSDAKKFIQDFQGSHHYIGEYLAEEVLNQQPENLREFLIKTSILEKLTGSLCDAVTEQSRGGKILESLEQSNLFLTPLDDERSWYRYHALFADLLRSRLTFEQPSSVPVLHRKASDWYARNGLMPEAIEHAFAAKDTRAATRLLEQIGYSWLAAGRGNQLLSWLDRLPEDQRRSNPSMSILYAWCLVFLSSLEKVEHVLDRLDTQLSKPEHGEDNHVSSWRGALSALRSRAAYLGGEIKQAIDYAQIAVKDLPEDETVARGIAAITLGLSHISAGDLNTATSILDEARRVNVLAGNLPLAVEAAGTLAQIQEARGFLHEAASNYREILRMAGNKPDPNVAAAHINLGNVLLEWHDLDGAKAHFNAGLQISRQFQIPDGLLIALVGLIRLYQIKGDKEAALQVDMEAQQIVKGLASSVLRDYVEAWLARLALVRNDLAAANIWSSSYKIPGVEQLGDNFVLRVPGYLTLAELWLSQHKTSEAKELLNRLEQIAITQGLVGAEINILALKAFACQQAGEVSAAHNTLTKAMQLAEPGGYLAAFTDLGQPMHELILRVKPQGVAPNYLAQLRSAFLDRFTLTDDNTQPLVEPLSERELEVLQLVGAGKSNSEIASELFVSIGTVKKHLSNIFGKMAVTSRTQCVALARQLELIK